MIQGNGIPKLGFWEGQTRFGAFIPVLEFRLLAGDRISGLPLFKNLMNTQRKSFRMPRPFSVSPPVQELPPSSGSLTRSSTMATVK